jgi:hypothetical protein
MLPRPRSKRKPRNDLSGGFPISPGFFSSIGNCERLAWSLLRSYRFGLLRRNDLRCIHPGAEPIMRLITAVQAIGVCDEWSNLHVARIQASVDFRSGP